MTTTEHTINDALAAVLRTTRRAWSQPGIVSSENTGILKHGAKQPDILVTEPNVSPVVIETEVMPAATVEVEAISRLGWTAPGLLDTRVRVFDLMRPPQLERVFPALPGPAFGSRSPRESNDGYTGS